MTAEALALGSLFDGSGGFPIAAKLAGIRPVWSSEIEPFAVRVTDKRLPEVRQLGDVRTLNGAEIDPVDIITFGSPCQDLSVAGKQTGIGGSRSSLFFDAIRIIKEARAQYGRPRFCIWENVVGALSSSGGEDFRRVLSEVAKIKDAVVSIPRPSRGWTTFGTIRGLGFSTAWRVLDARYFGVAQRRRRIYLVGDFDGDAAGSVLSETASSANDIKTRYHAWLSFVCAPFRRPKTSDAPPPYYLHLQAGRELNNGGINATRDLHGTLTASHFTFNYIAQHIGGAYRFRRLMPQEAALLQGFPADYCADLAEPDPSPERVELWRKRFEALGRPKTATQVRKWLCSEATREAQYKLWGNGIALPCALYVLGGIQDYYLKEVRT